MKCTCMMKDDSSRRNLAFDATVCSVPSSPLVTLVSRDTGGDNGTSDNKAQDPVDCVEDIRSACSVVSAWSIT